MDQCATLVPLCLGGLLLPIHAGTNLLPHFQLLAGRFANRPYEMHRVPLHFAVGFAPRGADC
jgi:hypothetical protein